MSKFSELKEAMKNPPEERLCLINAAAYKLNIMGIIIVILFLINYGVWYISLLFVFTTIINWVGFTRETKQYNAIVEAKKAMGVYKPIEDDISFTRKRFRMIKEHIGEWIKYVILAKISIIMFLISDPATLGNLGKVWFVLKIIGIFLIIYLFPVYWVAKWKGKKKKENKENE